MKKVIYGIKYKMINLSKINHLMTQKLYYYNLKTGKMIHSNFLEIIKEELFQPNQI